MSLPAASHSSIYLQMNSQDGHLSERVTTGGGPSNLRGNWLHNFQSDKWPFSAVAFIMPNKAAATFKSLWKKSKLWLSKSKAFRNLSGGAVQCVHNGSKFWNCRRMLSCGMCGRKVKNHWTKLLICSVLLKRFLTWLFVSPWTGSYNTVTSGNTH